MSNEYQLFRVVSNAFLTCVSRSSTEQIELLRKLESRQIFQKLADDTATLRSSRIGSVAGSQADTSTISDRLSSVGDTDFEFDDVIVSSAAYRQALHHSQLRFETKAAAALERGPSKRTVVTTTSDEGYASNTTGIVTPTRSLSTKSSVKQGQYRSLRPNDSVLPEHSRSKSVSFGLQPVHHYDPNIRRWQSTNTASPRPSPTGSKRDKLFSALRKLNTSSRVNLTTSSSRNLAVSPIGSSSTRGRKDRERDFTTSIDLTSSDGVNAPLIVKAAQSGSRFDIERLIESGHDIEARHFHSRRNALMVAAHCGKDDIVNLLLLNNARLNTSDASGSTALHLAASRGHLTVMELLLMEALDVEAKTSHGRTALWIAANKGQVEATQMLLANRAKVNTRADNQMTALHIAAQQGDFEIASLLTSHGADVDARDAAMMTALHYACEGGHLDVIELLLNSKANVDVPGSERRTPLICAAATGQLLAVQLLLKRRATFKCLDEGGMTALHWAAFNGHVEIVDLFSQKRGALTMANIQGRTALHLAIMNGQFAVVEFLMRRNPALDLKCQSGLNPLHYACIADSPEIVRLLLTSGADLEAKTENTQQRPIHLAAAGRSIRLLSLLCEKGASLESRDAAGDRALCVACRHGHVAAVQKLLDFGSPLHLRFRARSLEDSPLCLAAIGGHTAVVSLLIGYGASVLSKDEVGWSPIRYATYHGHPEVLEALLAANPSAANVNVDNQFSPDCIGMSLDKVTFAADPNISEDRKRRVLDILTRARRSPSASTNSAFSPQPTPPPVGNTASTATSSMPSSSVYQSYSTAPSYPISSFATPPQELPGTLEQGLPSSRSTTPVQMRRNRHNPSPDGDSETQSHARSLSSSLRVLPAVHEHHVDGQAVPADQLVETLRNLRLPEQPPEGTPPDTVDNFESQTRNYATTSQATANTDPPGAVEASTFSPFMSPRYIPPQSAVLLPLSTSPPPAIFSPKPIAPVTPRFSLPVSKVDNQATTDGDESIPSGTASP